MHINEMLNKKTYIGDIEPNPKEFGIWIKNDGSHMIYDYTNREWICNCSGSSKVLYYKVAAANDLPLQALIHCAGIKMFDAHDNKFEYIPTLAMIDAHKEIFPNFSDNDSMYFAYLPLDMKRVPSEGIASRIVAPTFEDLCIALGKELPAGVTRITAEEYWDDSIPDPTFSVEMKSYGTVQGDVMVADVPSITRVFEFEPGMTWEQWVDSKYNVDKWYFLNSDLGICWFKSDNPLYEVYINDKISSLDGFHVDLPPTSGYVCFGDTIKADNYRLYGGSPQEE